MLIFKDLKLSSVGGLFGALAFALAYIIGMALTLATGIPIASAAANGIVVCFIMVLGTKIIDKHGAFTLMTLVYSVLAIPTLLLGPPGPHKIIIGLGMGIVFDLIILITKKQSWGYILGSIVFIASGVSLVLYSMVLLGLPGIERLKQAFVILILVSSLPASIGAFLGIKVFHEKFEKFSLVKDLQRK